MALKPHNGNVIGTTQSGKKVYYGIFYHHSHYAAFTEQDHLDASAMYAQLEKDFPQDVVTTLGEGDDTYSYTTGGYHTCQEIHHRDAAYYKPARQNTAKAERKAEREAEARKAARAGSHV